MTYKHDKAGRSIKEWHINWSSREKYKRMTYKHEWALNISIKKLVYKIHVHVLSWFFFTANLGIGMPMLASNYIPEGMTVQSREKYKRMTYKLIKQGEV
jgi:hypothetical protein